MRLPRATLLALSLLQFVWGHVELIEPFGIRSRLDPNLSQEYHDYDKNAPLSPNGDNFPCKGYHTAEWVDRTTVQGPIVAGGTLKTVLEGATHDGGSCQWSVSYDQGKTWAVFYSVMGGCPLRLTYEVPIPENLPGMKKALIAWTWFNHTGNREMYMDCAVVDIEGAAETFTGPGIFIANIFPDISSQGPQYEGGKDSHVCETKEGEDYIFPNPGMYFEYDGNMNADSPVTVLYDCADTKNQISTVTVGPGIESTVTYEMTSGDSSAQPGSISGKSTEENNEKTTENNEAKTTTGDKSSGGNNPTTNAGGSSSGKGASTSSSGNASPTTGNASESGSGSGSGGGSDSGTPVGSTSGSSSSDSAGSETSTTTYLIIGGGVAGAVILIGLGAFFMYRRKRKRRRRSRRRDDNEESDERRSLRRDDSDDDYDFDSEGYSATDSDSDDYVSKSQSKSKKKKKKKKKHHHRHKHHRHSDVDDSD